MYAYLATLEGDHSTPHRRYRNHRSYHSEFMGLDLVDFVKDTGKSVYRATTAAIRGTGHFAMEAGRGISRGDISRIATSPFKGIGHAAGETFRSVQDQAEWFYRPSKMRAWMSPVGTAAMAAGAIPTPFSPIFLAAGAALSAGGAIGEAAYQKDQQGKAIDAYQEEQLKEEQKKTNMWLLASAGILGVSALITFT